MLQEPPQEPSRIMATIPSIGLPALHRRVYTSERELLTAYVRAGYRYAVIVQFLSAFHDLPMSLRTFKNRLHAYGIQRRLDPTPLNTVRDCIKDQLNTSAANVGYRQMHRIVTHVNDMHVSRKSVMELLSELDPAGSARRRSRSFIRRVYYCKGPNQVSQFFS